MENKLKKCKQCGEIRNEEEFRVYYNRNKTKAPGRYRLCKTCESINQRYKYLRSKKDRNTLTVRDDQELRKIEELYDVLRDAGLEPPTKKVESSLIESINDIMTKRKIDLERREEADVELDTPDELVEWLTKDLQAYHPDELEAISDRLWNKYRPKTGVDDYYKPLHDDTYREVLTRIQERFDSHEDEFYA
jgi:hypothetical protein